MTALTPVNCCNVPMIATNIVGRRSAVFDKTSRRESCVALLFEMPRAAD